MEKINEIKIPKGVDRIAVKQYDDKIVIEFIPKEVKFKEGDFVFEDNRLIIVKSYPNFYHANVWYIYSDKPVYNGSYAVNFSEPTFRYATEDEKQLLIDAMKKDGKRWNAEKLEIEDIPQPKFKVGDEVMIKKGISSETHRGVYPCFVEEMDNYIGKKLIVSKVSNGSQGIYYIMTNDGYSFVEDWLEPYTNEPQKGDLAIFWDNDYLNLSIRLYHGKSHRGNMHSDNLGDVWDNAVKWDGTKEQFEKVLRGEIN